MQIPNNVIHEIVEQTLRDEILLNWKFYLLMIAVMLIGTVGSAFITSYIRKRAENYATKTDLDQLIKQLRETTRTAEEVKTVIAHTDWSTKEWKTLRKIKLEELLSSVYEIEEWINKETNYRVFNGPNNSTSNPFKKV